MNEIVFVAMLLLIAYTYLGYPLCVWLLAQFRPLPQRCADLAPAVSVVMAVHNGQEHVARKVGDLLRQDYPAGALEVVVVSDGSTDATAAILRGLDDPRVRALIRDDRRGKSACLSDALALARGEVIVFTDVRQRVADGAIRSLVAHFADPHVGAVSGELAFEGVAGYGSGVDAYWRYEKFVRRNEARSGSVVGATGALYAVRRSAAPEIPPGLVLDDVWIPMRIAAAGHRVAFDTQALVFDRPSMDARQERARKRRTMAGNWQLLARWPGLLDPRRNPLWWRFVSHKLLRLLMPLVLAVALVANLALARASGAWAVALFLQLATYAVAVVGLALPSSRRWWPVRIASTFLEMNAYAVLGLIDFLRGRRSHLWSPSTTPRLESPP